MTAPEFSRIVDIRQADVERMQLVANDAERTALAERFGLVRIDRLEAEVSLQRNELVVTAEGRLTADIVQSCAVSAEDLPVAIAEELHFRFVPASTDLAADEEIEIDADDCDEIDYEGTAFDLGEALAQSLFLAIDPFLTGPEADEARQRAGITSPEDNSPFAALKGLNLKD
ncbi:MAG: DUF177 domain-containing protein [Novosphingobium sp.]|nr:DUF177 domain-containing protein [Novosphingobium sp.]